MPAKVRVQIAGTGTCFLKLLPVAQFSVPIRLAPDPVDSVLTPRRGVYRPRGDAPPRDRFGRS